MQIDRQDNLLQRVREQILEHQMIRRSDIGIAAVSGGADSVCMLYLLHALSGELGFRLVVAHVHHGIRGEEADRDADYVQRLSDQLGLECRVYHRDVPQIVRDQGGSLEEAGRRVRYACLEELKRETGARWIALAHHRDDAAETVLFHLIRGTGLRGLRGILPVQQDRIRPLLGLDREEIEAWLKEREIPYCTDSTNSDVTYARNRIRNVILPQMQEINPGAKEHILRLAQDAEERYAQILKEIQQTEIKCDTIDACTILPEFAEDPEVLGELILKRMEELAGSSRDISRKHIDSVAGLFRKTTGKRVDLPYGLEAVRSYEGVILRRTDGEKGKCGAQGRITCIRRPYISGEDIPTEKYRKMLDADRVTGELVLRTPQPEDRIMIHADGSRKKLQRFFIDAKVPQEARGNWPVVADDREVLWIVGLRLSESCKVTEATKNICLIEYTGEQ